MSTLKTSVRYPLPEQMSARLGELYAYWQSIQRGYHIMPYWDDVDMNALSSLRDDVILLDAPETPARFRFDLVGGNVRDIYRQDLEGRFVDELETGSPVHQLLEQCQATVDESAPTAFQYRPDSADAAAYDRILLPLWGNGRIEMLLGGIVPREGEAA